MMKKKIQYKEIEIKIEVNLNGVIPQPPAYQDTAARHIVTGTIQRWGWVEQRKVSDLHLTSEIDKVKKEAEDFIDSKTKPVEDEIVDKEIEHIASLTEKGFE